MAWRYSSVLRQAVVATRQQLGRGALGFIGAVTIHEQLQAKFGDKAPSIRTIGRILGEAGLLAQSRRHRHQPPPPGWYLPALAARCAELDCYDYIEDLRIEAGPLFQVLTTRGLWTATAAAWPTLRLSAAHVCACLLAHWRRHGAPHYAQFDNGTVFQGGHNWPDAFGQVTRFCLALGVIPVFAPPAEHGVQNLVEHFNGLWQQKVWQRFHHPSLAALTHVSQRFISAWCARRLRSCDMAPPRHPLAPAGQLDLRKLTPGTVIYLRRCDEAAALQVLGHRLTLPAAWAHRLVRVEVDLRAALMRCYGLRRSEPALQPLLHQAPYHPRLRPHFQAAVTSITWH